MRLIAAAAVAGLPVSTGRTDPRISYTAHPGCGWRKAGIRKEKILLEEGYGIKKD